MRPNEAMKLEPYYARDGVTIYHGDCRDVLPTLDPATACVTDPPYGLGFMGKDWDHAVPGVDYWRAMHDALRPDAMCMAFGGTRTFHRLACAIEDAGFQLRDCLIWLYGSGFPKSMDIGRAIDRAAEVERDRVGPQRAPGDRAYSTRSMKDRPGHAEFVAGARPGEPVTEDAKRWDGYGTALKPAWEPILLAMRPIDGAFAGNALKHGVSGLNIDACRIGTEPMACSRSDGTVVGRFRAMAAPKTGRTDA